MGESKRVGLRVRVPEQGPDKWGIRKDGSHGSLPECTGVIIAEYGAFECCDGITYTWFVVQVAGGGTIDVAEAAVVFKEDTLDEKTFTCQEIISLLHKEKEKLATKMDLIHGKYVDYKPSEIPVAALQPMVRIRVKLSMLDELIGLFTIGAKV